MSRLPKYADDFIPTVEKRDSRAMIVDIVAGVTLAALVFAGLRFIGVI